MNLMDELNFELKRAKELLEVYERIPAGSFSATIIRQTIEHTEACIQLDDIVGMIRGYGNLKRLE